MRGGSTIDEIVAAADNSFTRGSLSAWEHERWSPTNENVLALCKALNCKYEDISVEVEAETATP